MLHDEAVARQAVSDNVRLTGGHSRLPYPQDTTAPLDDGEHIILIDGPSRLPYPQDTTSTIPAQKLVEIRPHE